MRPIVDQHEKGAYYLELLPYRHRRYWRLSFLDQAGLAVPVTMSEGKKVIAIVSSVFGRGTALCVFW